MAVKSFFLDKRTDNRLLEIRRKKPFSRDKFIMVVIVYRRKEMKFFRSQVGSRSREQDLGFAERMIFFKSLPEIRSISVKELRQDSAVKSTLNLGTGC